MKTLTFILVFVMGFVFLHQKEEYKPFAGKIENPLPCASSGFATTTCYMDDGPGGLVQDWGTAEEYKL